MRPSPMRQLGEAITNGGGSPQTQLRKTVSFALLLAATGSLGAALLFHPLYVSGVCLLLAALGLLITHSGNASRIFSFALACLLVGYMFLGRGFAYLGVGPVYVGELVLALGIVALSLRPRCLKRLSGTIRLLLALLGAFMLLGAIRTLPYLDEHGLHSLRDSVIWGYASVALLLYLVVGDSTRLGRLLWWYRLTIPIFLVWIALVQVFTLSGSDFLPAVPGTDVPIIHLKPGDTAVHLAGIAVVLLLSPSLPGSEMAPPRLLAWPVWVLWGLWVIDSILIAVQNRGGALAILVAIVLLLFSLRSSRLLIPALIALVLLLAAATFDLQVGTVRGRSVSAEQLMQNLTSIIASDSGSSLDGTRTWRLNWWNAIVNYTIRGDYFWTGKGYGINLADDDGFQVYEDHSLRSPHNAHLTLLARSGVPGVVLWLLLQTTFITAMSLSLRRYRQASDFKSAGLCVVVLIYCIVALINGAFDVYLEGPQGGIWFWSVIGLGLILTERSESAIQASSALPLVGSAYAAQGARTDTRLHPRVGEVKDPRMDARDKQGILRKRKWSIVAITLACTIGAVLASVTTTPVYEGRATLLVVAKNEPGGGVSSAYQGTLLSQQLVKSFAEILQSRATAEAALRLDPVPISPGELQRKIKAKPVVDTLLIELSVEHINPARARRLTLSVARAFIQTVPRLQSGSAVRISMVEPPITPTKPIRPRTKLNVALGLLLGLMLGIGMAFLRTFVDRSVKAPEELESVVDVPVVGTIPPFKANKHPLPVADQPRSSAAEAFRKVRTNFAFLGIDRDNVCCVITSPAAGDGKSTVTANLGIALAQAGQRVAILDADLRRPSQHRLFGLHERVGTTTVLLDRAALQDALQHPGPNLPAVLTAGQLPPNPSELLGSRRMAQLVAELRSDFDVVLIDTAPVLPVTDPMVVSQFADGIVLVARAGSTSKDQAVAAKIACGKAGATLFGTVLNAAAVSEGDQPAYYAYYGGARRRNTGSQADLDLVTGDYESFHRAKRSRTGRQRRLRSEVR
jgi:capsular exopolysaccharide synthesis family protein